MVQRTVRLTSRLHHRRTPGPAGLGFNSGALAGGWGWWRSVFVNDEPRTQTRCAKHTCTSVTPRPLTRYARGVASRLTCYLSPRRPSPWSVSLHVVRARDLLLRVLVISIFIWSERERQYSYPSLSTLIYTGEGHGFAGWLYVPVCVLVVVSGVVYHRLLTSYPVGVAPVEGTRSRRASGHWAPQ